MSLDTLTTNQFSLVISQAAAPAFLLGAVASFLSVLLAHLNRLVDRSRAISSHLEENSSDEKLKTTLPQLKLRATNVGWAIYWAIGSGIATCAVIAVAFASAWFGVGHEFGAGFLFTVSLGLFTVSMFSFGKEIRASISQTEL